MWCKVCISKEPSYKNNVAVDREFNLPYAIRDQAAQTLYQHQSALPYMGCCTLSSCCSSAKGSMIVRRPTVQKTKALIFIVHDVVVDAVYVVVA